MISEKMEKKREGQSMEVGSFSNEDLEREVCEAHGLRTGARWALEPGGYMASAEKEYEIKNLWVPLPQYIEKYEREGLGKRRGVKESH